MNTTNKIKQKTKNIFKAMLSGEYNSFALFSVTCDGVPTEVIVNITEDGKGGYHVEPLFVRVTEKMDLRDPIGNKPKSTAPSKNPHN